ncbi:MAG: hypothetical protein WBZ36_01680 [Candidatus Nitrosopolaris sp.]
MVLNQGSHSRDNIWGFKIGEDGLSGHGPYEKDLYCDPSGGETTQEAGISCQGKRVIIAPQDITMELMLRVMIFSQAIPQGQPIENSCGFPKPLLVLFYRN